MSTETSFILPNDAQLIEINELTRALTYSGTLVLGVEHDHNAHTVYFKIPKLIGGNDLIDVSDERVKIHVNFVSANNTTYRYEVTDKNTDGEFIIFPWIISEQVTAKKGVIKFNVCVEKCTDKDTDVINNITYESITEDDGIKDIITYTVADNVIKHNITNCVVKVYVKKENTTYYVLDTTLACLARIEAYDADNKIIAGIDCDTSTGGSYSLTSTQLSELSQAKYFKMYDNVAAAYPNRYTKSVFELTVEDTERNEIVINEWHTTPSNGQVLAGIEVTDSTAIVTSNTELSSIYQLQTALSTLSNTVTTLSNTVTSLANQVNDLGESSGGGNNDTQTLLPTAIGVRDWAYSNDSSYGYETFEMESGCTYMFQDADNYTYLLTLLRDTVSDVYSTSVLVHVNDDPIEQEHMRYLVYNQSLKMLYMVDVDVYNSNEISPEYNTIRYKVLQYVKLPFLVAAS